VDGAIPEPRMSPRRAIAAIVCATALLAPASASAQGSTGTHEQIAWVRRAAHNFLAAELSGDGASACAILNAPLRATRGGQTCAQRWDAKLAAMRHRPAERGQLRSLEHAIPTATVTVHGNIAAIELPAPLLNGPNHFLWTENCWMLKG
jgi:hypothetical protein